MIPVNLRRKLFFVSLMLYSKGLQSLQDRFEAHMLSSLHTSSLQLPQLLPPRVTRQVVLMTL